MLHLDEQSRSDEQQHCVSRTRKKFNVADIMDDEAHMSVWSRHKPQATC